MTDISLPLRRVEVQAPIERFRKRPLEVEMMLWDGTEQRAEEIRRWIGTGPNARKRFFGIGEFPDVQPGFPAQLWVEHSKGWVSVHVGTRVAKEADGNGFYPISPDAIAGTFDPAPEPLELTPEERAAKAKHPHMSTCHDQDCQECVREIAANRRTIKAVRPVIEADARADERLALGAAGRLLPEGCSLRSDFRIRWFIATPDGGERVDEWGADSLQSVRELLEERPANALRYTVTFCEHWTSQYVPVDPKALERPDTEGGVDR